MYPNTPGYTAEGPSEAAAVSMGRRAVALRSQVEEALQTRGPLTADECAGLLGESVLAIRPRFTELRVVGRIEDTGARRVNASGKFATVWRITKGE